MHGPGIRCTLRETALTRILIASQPIAGHVAPLLPIVRELVRRGHQVHWYTGQKYVDRVRAVGAVPVPFTLARDFDDADFAATFPGRDDLRGFAQIQFDIRQIFVGQIEAQLRDLQVHQLAWPAEVVLAEQTMIAALLLNELGGPPCALLGILPLGIQSRDAAPFGLGLLPDASLFGQVRNAALHWTAQHLIFAAVGRDLRTLCLKLGVRVRRFAPPIAPQLMLQPTVPAFEYPQRDLPAQVRFIGPLLPEVPVGASLPAGWAELIASGRPVVLVTQGTLAVDTDDLIRPTLRALEHQDLTVLVAGVADADTVAPLPTNARVAPFVPFPLVLPHVAVFVTNGGYGGVQQALSHGIPVVVAGTSEDKAEVANRVQHAGVGVNLRTARPAAARLRDAILPLLGPGVVRSRAEALGRALRDHNAPVEAADLIEELTFMPKDPAAPVRSPAP